MTRFQKRNSRSSALSTERSVRLTLYVWMTVGTLAQDIACASRLVKIDGYRFAMTGEAMVGRRITTRVAGIAAPVGPAVIYREAMSFHCAAIPSPGRVAACARIVSEVVRTLMTVTADIVKVSEVRPFVTVEAFGLGVPAGQSHRMYGELRLVPILDGRMTVAAAERGCHVVRPNVAAAAILGLNI